MKRSTAIKIYKNNPNVKKVLRRIRGDNNRVLKLFDIVDEKVSKFCRTSKLSTDKNLYIVKNSLTLMIFGSLLMKISTAKESEYILNYIPVKTTSSQSIKTNKSKKGIILRAIPLDPSDWRPLNEEKIRAAVNEYLTIARFFTYFIDKDRKHNIPLISSLVRDIRDEKPLQTKIELMYTKTNLFNSQLSDSNKSTTGNKPSVGRPRNITDEKFVEMIEKLPKGAFNSQAEIARKLDIPYSTFKDYILNCKINIETFLAK